MSKTDNNPPNKKKAPPMSSNNPYAQAAGAYDKHAQKHADNPRELEARVLLKANKKFKALQENWGKITQDDLDDVLTFNRQIWMMFTDTAVEDPDENRSIELRNNIASLGMFIFKHTLDVLGSPTPEKLNVLIEINQEIAAGLMEGIKTENKPREKTEESSSQNPA